MKYAKWLFCLAVLGSWLLASAAVVLRRSKADEFSYSIFFPAPHKQTALATESAKEIEKRTEGKVKITIFPGGAP